MFLPVIRRLPHVDVIVRVHGLLASKLTPQHLNRTVCNDFVDVHVGLSARTGLPDDKGEVVRQLALHNLMANKTDL